jgi:hypothetical protein
MLCRNRVKQFEQWYEVFVSHTATHLESGLQLVHMWRDVEEPNNVFLLFSVESMDRAREFINHPDSARAGEVSGVIDGECHFLDDVRGAEYK